MSPARCSLLAAALILASCSSADTSSTGLINLGQIDFPTTYVFDDTAVGGLSGISYDEGRQVYYVISDDRSAKNAARFYTVRIAFADNRLIGVEWLDTTPLLDRTGAPFPPLSLDASPPVIPPDPEGIAFDERRQQLYWSSEGERITDDPGGPALLDPWVRIATLDGGYVGEFALPPMLHMSIDQTGPRKNNVLEGLTLSPSGRYLWAGMEGPGYVDGEAPTETVGALTRITRFDVETRAATAQYAYPLDPVSAGPGGDNGLSDLVAIDDENFIAVERGFGTHTAARIYRVSVGDADDVLTRPSLTGAPVRTMQKSLLVDLTSTVDPLDNVEGVTLGPVLPDGRQTLVLVSDDNFSSTQFTQFLAFAL